MFVDFLCQANVLHIIESAGAAVRKTQATPNEWHDGWFLADDDFLQFFIFLGAAPNIHALLPLVTSAKTSSIICSYCLRLNSKTHACSSTVRLPDLSSTLLDQSPLSSRCLATRLRPLHLTPWPVIPCPWFPGVHRSSFGSIVNCHPVSSPGSIVDILP